MPLCARPNCEHNSESCTAWLPAGRMVSNLSAAGQGIAWIELDGIEGRVWLADADGAGRRQLPALPDGFAAETLAAQDGQGALLLRQQVRGRPDHHRRCNRPGRWTAARPSSC